MPFPEFQQLSWEEPEKTETGLISTIQEADQNALPPLFGQASTSSEEHVFTSLENLAGVKSAISRLQRLLTAIRMPGIVSQDSKARAFSPTNNAVGFEEEQQHFEQFIFEIIRHKFPKAQEDLQRRLSRSNAARRRLFLYRKHRKDVLSTKRHTSPQRQTVTIADKEQDIVLDHFEPVSEANIDSMIKVEEKSINEADPQPFPNKATTFAESKFQPDALSATQSSTGGSSVSSFLTQSRLPPPPRVKTTGEMFECFYCYQLVPTKLLQKRLWRQHILRDLEPFICVFENCSSPDTRFYEKSSWTAHMQSHATRWTCHLPGHTADSKTPMFLDEDSYASHLRSHSRTTHLKDVQIRLLIKQSGRPNPTPIRTCPLCHDSMDETNIEPSSHATAIEEHPLIVSADAMYKHIASHLMLIASYSLPWSNDDDVDSDARPTSVTNSSDSVFVEKRNEINPSNSTSSLDEHERLVFEDEGNQEQYEKGEWEFLPATQDNNLEADHVFQDFKHKYLRQRLRGSFPMVMASNATFPSFSVPEPRIPSFVGRKDMLLKMDEALINYPKHSSPHHRGKSLHVSGLGGMGKSALALEYVYSRKHHFDVIIWLRGGDRATLESDALDAVGKLGLLRIDGGPQNDSPRSVLLGWLSKLPIQVHWLLVFDGVDETDMIKDYIPFLGSGSLLTTGRLRLDYSASAVLLQPLNHEESVQLLSIVSGRDCIGLDRDEEEAVMRWVRKFDGLPLALSEFAHFMRAGHWRFREVLDRYGYDIFKNFESWNGYHPQYKSISTVWDTTGLSTEEITLLDVLCCLHPDGISGSILLPPSGHLILTRYSRDQQSVSAALSQLMYFSLISISEEVGNFFLNGEEVSNSTFSIHRMVQEGRKSILTDEGRLSDVVISTAQLLRSSWTSHAFHKLHFAERFPACKELMSHVAQVHRIYANHFVAASYGHNDTPVSLGGPIRLFNDAAFYLYEIGDYDHAKMFCISASHTRESKLDSDVDLGFNTALQGLIATEMNDHKSASQHWEKCILMLSNMQRSFELAHAHYECSVAKANDRQPIKVYELIRDFDRSIEVFQSLENFEKHWLVAPKTYKGLLLHSKKKLNDAENELREAYLMQKTDRVIWNDYPYRSCMVSYALGTVFAAQERFQESVEMYKECLLFREQLGRLHPIFGDVSYKLAHVGFKNREFDSALDLVDDAYNIFKQQSCLRNKQARAMFLRGGILSQANPDWYAEGVLVRAEALKILKELNPDFRGRPDEVEDAFDMLIPFQYR
ncbi:hypothetical protein IQ07DRAFT_590224 [Pyrenochaeta sp. DS3sAY3a]|nr:hypothetical protein IQ07DRAFT_590224 [Pyrenochaeta sp. DS3sAY3a]